MSCNDGSRAVSLPFPTYHEKKAVVSLSATEFTGFLVLDLAQKRQDLFRLLLTYSSNITSTTPIGACKGIARP